MAPVDDSSSELENDLMGESSGVDEFHLGAEALGDNDAEEQPAHHPPPAAGGRGGRGGRGRGGGGGREKVGKGKKSKFCDGYAVCKVCNKKIPLADMPENSANCQEDKSYCEALQRLAVKQNQMPWYLEVRNDIKKLRQVIAAMKAKCPAYSPCKKKIGFEIAIYKEVMKALTEFSYRQKGSMMWQGQFEEFYMKPKGGSHSMEEAKARWTAMVLEVDAGLRLTDQDSPQAKQPVRVWVATGTDVDKVNRYMVEKILELQEKVTKKPTEEYIKNKRRKLSSNHNEFAGQAIDFSGIAAGLVSGGRASSSNPFEGGTGFDFQGPNEPQVVDLVEDEDGDSDCQVTERTPKKSKRQEEVVQAADDDRSQAPSQGGQSQADAKRSEVPNRGGGASPGGKGRGKAGKGSARNVYPLEDNVNLALSNWSIGMNTLKGTVNKTIADADAAMQTTSDNLAYVHQVKTLTNRMEPLRLVAQGQVAHLRRYIEDVKTGKLTAPSTTYASLLTLDVLERQSVHIQEAHDKESLKDAVNRAKEIKGVVSDLASNVNKSIASIHSVTTALVKAKNDAGKTKGKKGGTTAGSAASGSTGSGSAAALQCNTLWEDGPRLAKPVVTNPAPLCDLSLPFMMTQVQWAKQQWKPSSAIRVAGTAFINKFDNSDQKKSQGRAQQPIRDEVLEKRVRDFMKTLLPNDAHMNITADGWERMKKAAFFAVAQNNSRTYFEPEGVAAIRLQCLGTRSVLMAPVDAVHDLMMSSLPEGEKPQASTNSMKQYEDFVKKINKGDLTKLAPSLFTTTVGPYSAIYVPMGWVVSERVMNGMDVVGFRMPVFSRTVFDSKMLTRLSLITPTAEHQSDVTKSLGSWIRVAAPSTPGGVPFSAAPSTPAAEGADDGAAAAEAAAAATAAAAAAGAAAAAEEVVPVEDKAAKEEEVVAIEEKVDKGKEVVSLEAPEDPSLLANEKPKEGDEDEKSPNGDDDPPDRKNEESPADEDTAHGREGEKSPKDDDKADDGAKANDGEADGSKAEQTKEEGKRPLLVD